MIKINIEFKKFHVQNTIETKSSETMQNLPNNFHSVKMQSQYPNGKLQFPTQV